MIRNRVPVGFLRLSAPVQGFTLLEVMLATGILALVVSMVTVSLSGSLRVMGATRDQGDLYYRARVALQRISDDLESAILMPGVDFLASPVTDVADTTLAATDTRRVLVRFFSMAHVDFDPEGGQDGMGHIVYALVPDPENEGQLILIRSDHLAVPYKEHPKDDVRYGFLLSNRLRSVTFTYYDLEGEKFDSWDTRIDPKADAEENRRKRHLPAAVSCRLEFWLDREQETTLTFETSVKIPAGMIIAKKTKGNAA